MTGKALLIYQMPPLLSTKSLGIDIREATEQGAGKGRYALELTRALIEQAPEDLQFCLFTKKANPLFASRKNVHQVLIPGRSLFWHLNLKKFLKKNPVDFFLAPTSTLYPALAPKQQKLAIVIHDLITFLHPKGHAWFPKLVERLTLPRAIQKAQFLICVSKHTAEDLSQLFPQAHEKPVLIIPPAVSPTFHHISTQKMDLPQRFILGVGTLVPRKNFQLLFQTFPYLMERQKDLHIVIAGAKGWKHSRIFKTIPLTLKDRILFLGHVNDAQLIELYSRAQMLVFPSLYEGFGIPPLEAMACGCPVITSDAASLPEVVDDAAIQINPHNPMALAEAITRLLNPQIQEVYRKRGVKRVTHFSWKNSAKVFLQRLP